MDSCRVQYLLFSLQVPFHVCVLFAFLCQFSCLHFTGCFLWRKGLSIHYVSGVRPALFASQLCLFLDFICDPLPVSRGRSVSAAAVNATKAPFFCIVQPPVGTLDSLFQRKAIVSCWGKIWKVWPALFGDFLDHYLFSEEKKHTELESCLVWLFSLHRMKPNFSLLQRSWRSFFPAPASLPVEVWILNAHKWQAIDTALIIVTQGPGWHFAGKLKMFISTQSFYGSPE